MKYKYRKIIKIERVERIRNLLKIIKMVTDFLIFIYVSLNSPQ